jgi:hypothetical protein
MTPKQPKFDRRTFGKTLTGVALTGVMMEAQTGTLPRPAETRKGDMLYRSFGKTGDTASVVGVGGSHIGQVATDDASSEESVGH